MLVMMDIEKLNERFFGRNKAKEYIINDLTICVERLAYVHVLDAIMARSSEKYEAFHKETESGACCNQTTISIQDPLHYRDLAIMQSIAYDAMFLAIRKLFANSSSDRTSGGAWLGELKNFGKDNFLNAVQSMYAARMKSLGCELFQVVKHHDLKSRSLKLDNGGEVSTDNLFPAGTIVKMIRPKDDKYSSIALYSPFSARDFIAELEALYEKLYSSHDGRKRNNYGLIKEYERYQFHKDEWENDEKYVLTQEVHDDDLLGKINIINKKPKYKIKPFEIHVLLEDFARLLEHYMTLCLFASESWNWEVCHSYSGLDSLMNNLNSIFHNGLSSDGLQNEINRVREYMPHCLKIVRLT